MLMVHWLLGSILLIRKFPSLSYNLCLSQTSCFQSVRLGMCMSSKEQNTVQPLFFDDSFIDINNVGSMSLYTYNNSNYNDMVGSSWQSAQVSTFMNFSGQIFIGKYCSHFFPSLISVCIGLVSDYTKNKYGMSHSYCLTLVAVLFLISQVVMSSINDIAHLWISSALVRLALHQENSLLLKLT